MNNFKIHPKAYVAENVTLGDDVRILANAVVNSHVKIGKGSIISEGAVIGAFPYADIGNNGLFSVNIGENTFIGCNVVIQNGVERNTLIGNNCWINHLCNIGHDVIIADDVKIGLSSSVSGFTEIQDNVSIGPGCTLNNRSFVGYSSKIGIGSLLMHHLQPNVTAIGRPAIDINLHNKIHDDQRLQRLGMKRAREPRSRIKSIYRFIPCSIRKPIGFLIRKINKR